MVVIKLFGFPFIFILWAKSTIEVSGEPKLVISILKMCYSCESKSLRAEISESTDLKKK